MVGFSGAQPKIQNMKKFTVLFALMGYSISIMAQQEAPLTRDFGISVSHINLQNMPLNLTYKRGRGQKFWRFEASNLSLDLNAPGQISAGNSSTNLSRISFGLRIAREKRKEITDRFSFYRGIEFGVGMSAHENLQNADDQFFQEKRMTVTPRLGYSIGGIFELSHSLYLSGELSPHIFYRYSNSQIRRERDFPEFESDTVIENHQAGINISQGAINVGLFYTFTK